MATGTEVGFRHGDYPIGIGGSFVSRMQDFSVQKNDPATNQYELGNESPIGSAQGEVTYRANLNWFFINMDILRKLSGSSGSILTWTDLYNAESGPLVSSPTVGMGNARASNLTFDIAVQQESRATAQLAGDSRYTQGSLPTLVATDPVGTAAYRANEIYCTVNGTTIRRAQRINLQASGQQSDLYEIGFTDPAGNRVDRPDVTCTIDWVEGDGTEGDEEMTRAAPGNILIDFGTSVRLQLQNMASTNTDEGGSVQGWATRRITYQTQGDLVSAGLRFIDIS